jgi:hypothetical protein
MWGIFSINHYYDTRHLHYNYLDYDLGPLCKLRSWVDKLDYNHLAKNFNAINLLDELLENYLEKIWGSLEFRAYLFGNVNAMPLIEKWIREMNYFMNNKNVLKYLSLNTSAIRFLDDNPKYINWKYLSKNPKALPLLEIQQCNIDWSNLCVDSDGIEFIKSNMNRFSMCFEMSTNPNASELIEKLYHGEYRYDYNINPKLTHLLKPENMDFLWLSGNYGAVKILEQYIDSVNYIALSSNSKAIHLLENNLNKVDWNLLSANPGAIHILEKNQDKINWSELSANPAIFEYDYEAMRSRMKPLAEQLMAKCFHPRNFDKWVSWGFDEFKED